MLGVIALLGVVSFDVAKAEAPKAAGYGAGGYYCPPGSSLVYYNTAQWVTWTETTYVWQRPCIAWGPLGFCRLYGQPVQVPKLVTKGAWVPATQYYCVYNPVPYPPYPYPAGK